MTNPEHPWSVLLLVSVVALVLGYYTAGFVRDYPVCKVEDLRMWGRR